MDVTLCIVSTVETSRFQMRGQVLLTRTTAPTGGSSAASPAHEARIHIRMALAPAKGFKLSSHLMQSSASRPLGLTLKHPAFEPW